MYIFYFLCLVIASNTETNIIIGKIVYESFLDLDSLLFLVESQNLSKAQTKNFIEQIIFPVREYLIKIKEENKNSNNVTSLKETFIKRLSTFNSNKPHLMLKEQHKNENPVLNKKKYNTNNFINPTDKTINFNKENNLKDKIFIKHNKVLDLKRFSINKQLETAVKTRYDLFNADKSNIARNLYNSTLNDIIANLKLIKTIEFEKSFVDINLNKDYMNMVEYLYDQIMENKMLTKILNIEKEAFYSKYKTTKNKYKNLTELRMEISLAGSIMTPGVLINIFKSIQIDDVEKIINKLTQPVALLFKHIKSIKNSEKKNLILKFLNSCLKRKDNFLKQSLDEAYKIRSFLVQKFIENLSYKNKKSQIIFDNFDKYQQNETKNLIKEVEKLQEKDFENIIYLTDNIKQEYIKLLMSDSQEDKEKIKKTFSAIK
ncbi:hypothetical protein SLOPH_1679 [Spraguea lophii 42_110]|uniref:Uncharacterized protein n=1 Tax=Spraguea lophii (strain 42_110) TaxID=1358809 RepID=S7WB32_SPRLO|nr:hypothetical protein SLOPH_1679 [Spraguea lophii 42_110]